ncbi:glycosyltransferase family 1 protein [Sulfurovum sp.]|uniref:glycosyltransferase family 4 protein n=1 Tax=Sulfurovum sp. TaxID=1969726 RepID=UPI0025D74E6E|nr:glycosyltransferase family 1 protein [Sulfurovum sp.]
MHIILESSALLHQQTGIGRYNLELAKGLQKSNDIEHLSYYVDNRVIDDFNQIKKMQYNKPRTYPLATKPFRIVKNYVRKQRVKHQCENSLVHATNFFLPECAQSGVTTVHDLSIFKYPETHPKERIEQFEKHFLKSLERTLHIITDSKAVKEEVMAFFGWDKEKISVAYLGVASAFRPRDNPDVAFLKKYGLSENGYTLCVSTIEPRKNIGKLLDAYEHLSYSVKKRWPLVLIGGYGWHFETIMKKIEKAQKEGWVIRPGYVSEEELFLFYQHAHLFVYPSEYEGFGLPVAEAMASGVPVITSDRSCLPEVASGAGLVVNPDDDRSFLEALEKGLDDALWRSKARIEGIEVASRYNWDKCVKDTIEIYKGLK